MTGYSKGGKIVDFNALDCLARTNTKEDLFYVRMDRKTNSLYNPDDALNEVSLKEKIKGTGIERCPFISVSKETFNLYLTFLKAGNLASLTQANRALKS